MAHDVDVVTLGAQEVLGEVGGVRIAFDEQNRRSPLGGLAAVGTESRIAGGEPLGECSMRVRGAQSELHLLAHEPELVQVVAEYNRCAPALRSGTTKPYRSSQDRSVAGDTPRMRAKAPML